MNSDLAVGLIACGFTVTNKRNQFRVFGAFQGRGYSFILVKEGTKYRIAPPTYKFGGTISHFTFTEQENRFFRNKQLIAKIVGALHKVGLWDKLINQDFFIINRNNVNLPTEKVMMQYRELLKG